jgi:hypothetical protein
LGNYLEQSGEFDVKITYFTRCLRRTLIPALRTIGRGAILAIVLNNMYCQPGIQITFPAFAYRHDLPTT